MKRSAFIKTISLMSLSGITGLKSFGTELLQAPHTEKMPVLFIGHGSPMNAIEHNPFTKTLAETGKKLPVPKAILVVSAHWLTRGTYVADTPNPKTIYDFGGFPKPLYEVTYPAPGAPEMAKQVQELVKSTPVRADHEMGFDHGAWSVLRHLYPEANIPVFQMSIDYGKPAAYHYELAKELAALRSKGVMIVSSGNIVHNLGMLSWQDPAARFDWSIEFDEQVKQALDTQNHKRLINYQDMGKAAQLAVPTNDHYLPLLYSIGLQEKNEEVKYLYESIEMGSISMRCFMIGG